MLLAIFFFFAFDYFLLKNNTVFSEFKRACSPDYVIFMRSTGCPVKY